VIYIDVNVIQYWLTGDKKFGPRAKEILKRHGKKVTSALTLWILFILNEGMEKEVMEAVGEVEIDFVPLSSRALKDAVTLSTSARLDIEDAVHYSVMRQTGTNEIASNDSDFDRVPDVTRVF